MDGFKSLVTSSFDNSREILSKFNDLKRKNSANNFVVTCLEKQMRQVKLDEACDKIKTKSSFSTTNLSQSSNHKNTEDILNETKQLIIEKNMKIEQKNEEIRQLNRQIHKMIEFFKTELSQKDAQIRELHNDLVNAKGQIRVAVRIRDYDEQTTPEFATLSSNEIQFCQNGQENKYRFEHIFNKSYSQQHVFDEINELILSVLHGYNVCLIAYGPTGSGKTFTMRGEGFDSQSEGVIPRSIRFLLDQSSQNLAIIGWKFSFSASYLEVYNEEVFDLLDNRKRCYVKIQPGNSTNVSGLRKISIETISDVDMIISLADRQRSTASTGCNTHSSRSHALFQIHVDAKNVSSDENLHCCLNLVDLAGSERAKESGAKGERFTELTNINQSLTTLKKCIRAQMNQTAHVPYRESKLTILLRSYLGAGSSKTMFIAHINPNESQETKRTLDFTSDLRSTNIGKSYTQTSFSNTK